MLPPLRHGAKAILLAILLALVICHWAWLSGLVLCSAWWAWACLSRREMRIPPLTVAAFLFCLCGFASAWLGLDLAVSWNSCALLLSYAALWVLAWNLGERPRATEALFWAILISLVPLCYGSIQQIIHWYAGWWRLRNATYPFQPELMRLWSVRNYPNEFAIYLVTILPVVFQRFLTVRHRAGRSLLGILVAALCVLLVYCRSRTGWISLGAEAFVAALLFPTSLRDTGRLSLLLLPAFLASVADDFALQPHLANLAEAAAQLGRSHSVTPFLVPVPLMALAGVFAGRWRASLRARPLVWIAASALAVLGGSLALGMLRARSVAHQALSQSFSQDVGSGRAYVWGAALDGFRHHPLFGVGPGCFGRLWAQHWESSASWVAMHGHNISLDLLASSGIVGWAVFSVGFVLCLRMLLRRSELAPVALVLVVVSGNAAALFFDSPFTSPTNLALLIALAGILLSSVDGTIARRRLPGPLWLALVLVPALILNQATTIIPGLGSFGHAEELADSGQADSAIAEYRRAVETNPGHALFSRHLGIALARTGSYAQAIPAFERSIQGEPNHGATWLNLAEAKIATGDSTGAANALEQASLRAGFAFHFLPQVWRAQIIHSPDTNLFRAATNDFPLFPATEICWEWADCREWARRHVSASPDWSGLAGQNPAGTPPKDPYLAYFWHQARGEPVEQAWIRNHLLESPGDVSRGPDQLQLLAYLAGFSPIPGHEFRNSGNSVFLDAIETSQPILLPGVERRITPRPFGATAPGAAI